MCPHCLNCTCDRSVLFRWKKIYWQSFTGNGSLLPPFGLVGFERIKRTWNYIYKVTPSEKKILIDDFTALGFQNYDTSGSFFSNLPSKLDKFHEIYPVKVRINLIFHGPGHVWPGFFECLQLKNLLSEKILTKLYSWRSFSLYFLLQDSPPTMMPIWPIPQKVQKNLKSRSYETWAMEILPPCHVTPPPSSVLSHADLRNSILCAGGGEGPWHGKPKAQNLNVSFNI